MIKTAIFRNSTIAENRHKPSYEQKWLAKHKL